MSDNMDWFFDAINNPDKLLKSAPVHKHIFKEDGHCDICGKTIFEVMKIK
jgi:hypothetical protein